MHNQIISLFNTHAHAHFFFFFIVTMVNVHVQNMDVVDNAGAGFLRATNGISQEKLGAKR